MILSQIGVSEPSRHEIGLSGGENESGTEVRGGEGLVHPESSNFDPRNHGEGDHTRKERSLSVEKPMQKAKKDKTRPHRKTSLKGGKSSQNPEKADTFQPSENNAPSSSTGPAIGKQQPIDANAAKKRGPKRKNKPDLKGDREIGNRDETGFTPNRSHVRRDQESSGNQHSDPANPTHNPKQAKTGYQDGQGQGVYDWKINEYEDYPSDQDRAKGVKRMVLGLEDLVREKFEIIRETINQKSHADLCIPDQLTLAFDNIQKDILEKLQNVIKSKVKTEFMCNFEDMILPVFEKYLQKIFEKVCATFEKGHKFYVDRLMIENSKSNNLRESLNQLLDNFLNASENIRTSVQDTAQLQYNLMKTYEANIMKGEFAAINGKLETMMGHQNSLMGQILSINDRIGHLEQRDRLSDDVFEKFENRLIGVISKLNSGGNPNVVTYQNSNPNAVVYQSPPNTVVYQSAPLVIQRDNFAEVQKREIAQQGRVNLPVSGGMPANRQAQDRPIGNFFEGEPVRVEDKAQAHVNLPTRNSDRGAPSGANVIQEPIDNTQRGPQQSGNRQPERGAQSGNDRGAPKGNGNGNGNGGDRGMPKKGNYIKYGNHVVKLDSDDEAKNSQKLSRPNAPEQPMPPKPPKPTAQVDAGETNKADFMFNQAMGMMNQTQNQNQNQNNQILNSTQSQAQNPNRDNLPVKTGGPPGIPAENFQAQPQSAQPQMPNPFPVASSKPQISGDIFSQLGGMGMKAPLNSNPQKPMNVQYFSENLSDQAPTKPSKKPPTPLQKPQQAQPANRTTGANLVDQFSMFQQELNMVKKQSSTDRDADLLLQNNVYGEVETGPAGGNLANQAVRESQRKLLSRDSSGFSVSKYGEVEVGGEGQKGLLLMSPEGKDSQRKVRDGVEAQGESLVDSVGGVDENFGTLAEMRQDLKSVDNISLAQMSSTNSEPNQTSFDQKSLANNQAHS